MQPAPAELAPVEALATTGFGFDELLGAAVALVLVPAAGVLAVAVVLFLLEHPAMTRPVTATTTVVALMRRDCIESIRDSLLG